MTLLAGATAAAMAAAPAFAQVEAAAAATATDAADQQGLADIVVTATKRETNLQKTPIAISVLDPVALQDRHVQSMLDLMDGSVPSLRVTTFEARQSALTVGIRGIVPFDQNQTARDTGVGVYIDGVYLGRSQGLNAALFDVERIEVLRGPQGTLFGRNTEGGAVSIVTKAPTGEFGGDMQAGVGNYGSYNGAIHLNLPTVANVSVKLDGVVQHQDPTVKNPLAGQAGWNQYDRVGGRATAVWKPVEGFSATFTYDQSRDENTPNYSQLINYNPTNLPVGTYSGTTLVCPSGASKCIAPLSPLVKVSGDKRMKTADIGVPQQPSVDKTHGFSANLKYELSPNIEVRSITAWRGVDTEQWDGSAGAHRAAYVPNGKFGRYSLSNLHQRQFSQEFQLVGHSSQFDWVAGLYYFNEHVTEYAATPSDVQWNSDGTGYTILSETVTGAVTSSNQGWAEGDWFIQRASRARARSYAGFAQGTYTPEALSMVHFTAGGRVTNDKREGVLYTVQGKATNYTFNYDRTRFDPMVTVAVDVVPTAQVYAKYSTGYRAGGANDRSQTFASFGPEVVKSYEIGTKMDLFDRHVRLNVAGYLMDRTGTQIDFDNVDTNASSPTYNLHTEETRNAPGTSKIRGIEMDVTIRPVNHVTLGGSYAYTYTHVPATANPFLNDVLYQVYTVYTPTNAASVYADYDIPVLGNGADLRFHLDANYASSQYSFQAESVKTDASLVVNGRVALAHIPMNDHKQELTVSVWSRNLLDTTYIYRRSAANATTLGDYGNFNTPRTFGADVSVKF